MKRLSLMDFVLIVDDLEASFLRAFGVPAPKANSYSKTAVENNALIMPKYKRQNGGDPTSPRVFPPIIATSTTKFCNTPKKIIRNQNKKIRNTP